MDDLKVQLESRQDLEFLREELRTYLNETAFTITDQQRERVSLKNIGLLKYSIVLGGGLCSIGPEYAN